jgi:hypothetical protein
MHHFRIRSGYMHCKRLPAPLHHSQSPFHIQLHHPLHGIHDRDSCFAPSAGRVRHWPPNQVQRMAHHGSPGALQCRAGFHNRVESLTLSIAELHCCSGLVFQRSIIELQFYIFELQHFSVAASIIELQLCIFELQHFPGLTETRLRRGLAPRASLRPKSWGFGASAPRCRGYSQKRTLHRTDCTAQVAGEQQANNHCQQDILDKG